MLKAPATDLVAGAFFLLWRFLRGQSVERRDGVVLTILSLIVVCPTKSDNAAFFGCRIRAISPFRQGLEARFGRA